jgi:hypothetical protein
MFGKGWFTCSAARMAPISWTFFSARLFGPSSTGFVVPGGPDSNAQIEAHRKMIQGVIDNRIGNRKERIRQRYMWLALYNNSTVKQLQAQFGDKVHAGLEIPESLLDF